MMRVLHVMSRMAAGGTEVQLLGMLKAAHGERWDATLCVLSDGWALNDEAKQAGIPVLILDGRTPVDPRRVLAFRELVREYDVIHSSLPGANAFARVSTAGLRRPAVVVSERGVDNERSVLRGVIDRVLTSKTDAFIGNSDDVTEFIRSSHRLAAEDPRVFEVGNGMDLEIFSPGRLGATRPRKRIIIVGRLVPGKRVDMAIDVFRRVQSSRKDLEMIIVGAGPERAVLERQADDLPITFLGHVADRSTMARHLRRADLFLMTSSAEGLPNALLEALACGLPVVAADVPGIRAAAGRGVTLIDGDIESWSDAILRELDRGRHHESLVGDRVDSFETVAARHFEVFEWASKRHQEETGSRRHHQRRSLYPEVRWPIQSTLNKD